MASDIRNNGTAQKKYNIFCFIVFFYSLIAGCSKPTREKMLRIFFDGVPGPQEEKAIAQTKEEEKTIKKEIKPVQLEPQKQTPRFHPPFLENQCDSCHESQFSQRLVSKDNDLCFACHDDVTKDNSVVHYPISDGACIDCHDPHQSPHGFLLKNKLPELCFNCHDESDIRSNPVHEDQSLCTQCHNPHASNEEKLLK